MIYVRIPEKHDAKGFLLLAKSGSAVSCLPDNIYGVVPEHLKLLKRGGFRLENYPPKACGFPNLLSLHEKRMRFICRRKYNDGKEIEAEKIKQIRKKLIAVFGALPVSSQSAPYQDSWKYDGVDFIDDIIKIEIIAAGDRKTDKFFKEFKEQLKRLLKQIDILITAQNIRTI
jgi:hypothetical protein